MKSAPLPRQSQGFEEPVLFDNVVAPAQGLSYTADQFLAAA
jgi:hypothetical protein